jgi:Ca-activated chloride channel homolog
LLNKLSDFLLQSGFRNPDFDEFRNSDKDLQSLHDAILNALIRNSMLPGDLLEQLKNAETGNEPEDSRISQLIQHLVQRLEKDGYVRIRKSRKPVAGKGGHAQLKEGQVRFELTDKAIDFLGYKTLKNLLGSLGKSSFGRHDTRDFATGVEANGVTKPYEFGDTLNLARSASTFSWTICARRFSASTRGK